MKTLPVIDPALLNEEENSHLSQSSFPTPGEGDFVVKMPTGCFRQPFSFCGWADDRAREIVAKFAA